MKRTWNLAPVVQIVQKITENYYPYLYLSVGQVWWLVQKIYSKMYLVSCTNTHRNITDSINHRIVTNTKTWISSERNIIFLRNKKNLNLCHRWHILRSYRYEVQVTFKGLFYQNIIMFRLNLYLFWKKKRVIFTPAKTSS